MTIYTKSYFDLLNSLLLQLTTLELQKVSENLSYVVTSCHARQYQY